MADRNNRWPNFLETAAATVNRTPNCTEWDEVFGFACLHDSARLVQRCSTKCNLVSINSEASCDKGLPPDPMSESNEVLHVISYHCQIM